MLDPDFSLENIPKPNGRIIIIEKPPATREEQKKDHVVFSTIQQTR